MSDACAAVNFNVSTPTHGVTIAMQEAKGQIKANIPWGASPSDGRWEASPSDHALPKSPAAWQQAARATTGRYSVWSASGESAKSAVAQAQNVARYATAASLLTEVTSDEVFVPNALLLAYAPSIGSQFRLLLSQAGISGRAICCDHRSVSSLQHGPASAQSYGKLNSARIVYHSNGFEDARPHCAGKCGCRCKATSCPFMFLAGKSSPDCRPCISLLFAHLNCHFSV